MYFKYTDDRLQSVHLQAFSLTLLTHDPSYDVKRKHFLAFAITVINVDERAE